MPQITFY